MNIGSIGDEFAGADLGDPRRERRLGQIAERIAGGPDQSVPKATATDAELEGCYRFLNNERVTSEAILAPHQRRTVERSQAHQEVLVVHDTSAFRFTNQDTRQGLGPLLAKHGMRGFYAHVSMVVALGAERDPLGVLATHTYNRSFEKTTDTRRRITDPTNEYHRFARAIDECEKQLAGRATAIHVIDREADIYELFARLVACKCRFVIRLSDDRATPEQIGATKSHVKLSDILRSLDGIAEREVPLSPRAKAKMPKARNIHPARDGRIAKLSYRATNVEILRPGYLPRELSKSIVLRLVHVLEVDPPEGEAPVEWQLLTSEPIDTVDDVLRVVDIYRARWIIEELFKALKTGCEFEKRQFRSYDALCRLLAVMLPVAWRMLRLRAVARAAPDRPARDLLTPTQLAVLVATSKRVLLSANPTADEALRAIAGLGGHLKRNGPPGWITLGRGLDTLLAYEIGYVAALQDKM